MEALEGLEASWLPGESHSCLNPCVTVPISEVTAPSGGQVEVEGFCKDSATSDELTPFSAKEPEWRHEERGNCKINANKLKMFFSIFSIKAN